MRIGVLLLILGVSAITENAGSPANAESISVSEELAELETDAILVWVDLPVDRPRLNRR